LFHGVHFGRLWEHKIPHQSDCNTRKRDFTWSCVWLV